MEVYAPSFGEVFSLPFPTAQRTRTWIVCATLIGGLPLVWWQQTHHFIAASEIRKEQT
jgi:hypothetical protein